MEENSLAFGMTFRSFETSLPYVVHLRMKIGCFNSKSL